MVTKARITGFLMVGILALSAPIVYADGGTMVGGQTTAPTVPVSSDQGEHQWKDGQEHHIEGRLFHKLNLTDAQKKQLENIWQKQKEAMKATFEQIKANREVFNKELVQPKWDMNKINGLQAQLKTLQAQMVDSHLNSILEAKKILTPRQFSLYLQRLEKIHKFGEHSRWRKERKEGCGCEHSKSCRYHHHSHKHWDHDDDDSGE